VSGFPLLSRSLLALSCVASGLNAHTTLVSPNGGEVLRVGTKVTIQWRIDIPHAQKGWNLWYSTTGAAGPWITIKIGMPIRQLSLVWTVPDTVSSKVRFRIRMDNPGTSYEDVSDADLKIIPSMSANTTQLSLAKGGAQALTVDAGKTHKNLRYWIFGSETGTSPGVDLLGVRIPLNVDLYTVVAMGAVNSKEFTNFRGTLDSNGLAKASFNIPANLPFGLSFHHAYVVYDPNGKIYMASNAVPLRLK
jgi:hypothetical protein